MKIGLSREKWGIVRKNKRKKFFNFQEVWVTICELFVLKKGKLKEIQKSFTR